MEHWKELYEQTAAELEATKNELKLIKATQCECGAKYVCTCGGKIACQSCNRSKDGRFCYPCYRENVVTPVRFLRVDKYDNICGICDACYETKKGLFE